MRDKVFNKYSGRCAYSGTLLEKDWQIDHMQPKIFFEMKGDTGGMNDINNLMPVQRIVNHYKRGLSLEEFRKWYLGGLHERLKKLPKNPTAIRSIRRKEYLLEVAKLFGITADKPFSGVFYFELDELNQIKGK